MKCNYDVMALSLQRTENMALTPKTAVLQMRLDPDLLRRFQAACDARDDSVSHVLRRFIHGEVEAYERHLAKKRLQEVATAVFVAPRSLPSE